MSIATGKGDKGRTGLFSGEVVSKDAPRMQILGDLDELNAALGLARTGVRKAEVRREVLGLQRVLFDVASEVATSSKASARLPRRIDASAVKTLTDRLHGWEARMAPPQGFIIPGGTAGGSQLDVARAVCRRAERGLAGLIRKGVVKNHNLLVWMNRLSDLLWLLARHEEGKAGLLKESPQ